MKIKRKSKAEKRADQLIEAHESVVTHYGGRFYNQGWGSGGTEEGGEFISSKTSVGRLHSEIDADGEVTHRWLPGGGIGFSADLEESVDVDLALPNPNVNPAADRVESGKTTVGQEIRRILKR
jgi:hypothetical protein